MASRSRLWADHFNVGWLLRATQQVTTRVDTTLSFWVIALIYVMLGLLEVENVKQRIERLDNRAAARVLLDGSAAMAAKFRKYLLVRTQMSAVTGVPITLAILTFCAAHPSSHWVADLFGGPDQTKPASIQGACS